MEMSSLTLLTFLIRKSFSARPLRAKPTRLQFQPKKEGERKKMIDSKEVNEKEKKMLKDERNKR